MRAKLEAKINDFKTWLTYVYYAWTYCLKEQC